MPFDTRTATTTQLLQRLHDPQQEAVWREFDARYRPIITHLARRLGLGAEDAADVAQETLTEFVRDYQAGKYDPQRGRLRSWIIAIARHRIYDTMRRRAVRKEYRGESAICEVPDEARLTAIWNAESERILFERAMTELREQTKTAEKTLRAFHALVLDGASPEAVAETHGLTVAEVYRIKNRITSRLREIVSRLESTRAEAL